MTGIFILPMMQLNTLPCLLPPLVLMDWTPTVTPSLPEITVV